MIELNVAQVATLLIQIFPTCEAPPPEVVVRTVP